MNLFDDLEEISNAEYETSTQIIDNIIADFTSPNRELPSVSGYKSLEYFFKGFKRNQITILSARTSMGKTCAALNLTLNQLNNNKTILYIDLEEQKEANFHRMLSNIANYPLRDKLDNEELTQFDYDITLKILNLGKDKLRNKNLYYVSKPNLTLNAIEQIAKTIPDLDLIVIDHLTKIKSNVKGSLYERVTDVASNLRQLSYNLNGVPLLVLAQINRGTEDKKDKRPLLSDLKGSGEIEENADVVIMLYSEGYYESDTPDEEPIEFIFRKNRHGRIGTAKLLLNRPLQKITDIK